MSPENSDNTVFAGSTTPPRSTVLEPGAVIASRYEIERELGRGGIGVVYLARDRQLHAKPVVLKALLDTTRDNEWLRRKFHQEVEALARIDHPGIVGVLDAGDLSDGTSYFVMQFVDGASLRKAMRQEGMEPERVAAIVRQLGRALEAAHARGIYHRDLKPENVMLQPLAGGEEQVKVIDFGIAHIKDSAVAPDTATRMAVGTVVYMAPEQLAAKSVSAATDVYALGILTYEMLTGRRPFAPETMFQLLDLQREGVQVFPSTLRAGLPAAVDTVIGHALVFEAADRYQSAREFADDLARALAGGGATGHIAAKASTPLGPAATEIASSAPGGTELARDVATGGRGGRTTLPGTEAAPTEMPETVPLPDAAPPTVPNAVPAVPVTPTVPVAPAPPPARGVPVGLIATALLVAVVAIVGWVLTRPSPDPDPGPQPPPADGPAPVPAGQPRELRFSLTVQKMRGGAPYEEPFQATGQEIYEGGYRFWMSVTSADAGYLYVVNQGPEPRNGMTSYNFLHPINNGSAAIAANTPVSVPPRNTNGFQFDTEKGTEQMWIVWSKDPAPELEAVKKFANPKDGGVISAPDGVAALERFFEQQSAAKPETVKDGGAKQLVIRGRGDTVVVLQPLEHQ